MNTRIQAVTAGALAAIAAGVAIPALTGAQASPARPAAHKRPIASQADQLRAIERTRLHALVNADTATAGRLMASDFQGVTPTGDTLRRTDYLGSVAAGVLDYLVFEPVSRIAVRRSGDSAALRYKVSFDIIAGGPGGTRVTHKGWITELWERRAGHWLLVWEQATAIPNNFDLFLQSIEPPGQP
jgi:hypothetical protein